MTKDIEARISELEARLTKIEAMISPNTTLPIDKASKKMSAKEFLLTRNIKTDLQKTLALIYYLEHEEGLSSFNINDLALIFQAAKESRPGNLSDTVGKNMARGLLMDAPKKDGKKAWMLTATGEKYVEDTLKK